MIILLPKRPSAWIFAFTPAVASFIALWAAETWFSLKRWIHLPDGVDVLDVGATLRRMGAVTMGTVAVFSLLIAIVITRKLPLEARIPNTLSMTFCLIVANAFVAFGGCTAGSVISSFLR